MFTYGTTSKPKNLKGTKVTPELIEHFKNTAEIPKRSFKENQNPKQSLNLSVHPDIKIENKNGGGSKFEDGDRTRTSRTKIVEEDISKIASSYILEGNILKKQEAFEEAMRKQKKKASQKDKQNTLQSKVMDRKEILKLQYLQKMGFLRPDEKQFLAQYRKNQAGATENPSATTVKKVVPNQISQAQRFNTETTSYGYPFYSPKTVDPKKINHLFASNGKFMMPTHMHYY